MSEISAKTVAELRKQTGVGMMECKKALGETDGNIDQAIDLLRKRGAEMAAKRSDRATNQGWVGSYIHSNGRIGVIVEVLCETDFVAKNEMFQVLIRDIAMHIAAMNPMAIAPSDLDPELIERERSVFAEQVKDKPEHIQGNIVEGKLQKYYSEVCLLNQAFIKEDKKSIEQVIQDAVGTIGENIQLTRFHRLEIGQ
ncbi:MAG: translation elongation factor Ts [Planctomycetes bacterium]|jgi:elongation factor Ts|nr:translation elongation factor Ts [Planctomycetota bacterium]MBT6452891.1 translation elongation factor Ts [Planctomycetota bacterium]MBT6541575.1 translation elongation factor Ts [Planctomycetota bacterium]MBT6783692.1 translation elongation factor Ts [Planctomycetota bacterium]MBT6967494.1 translation elongation factor Ts [Planctomycetota bacterium]